jgi:hypothetical protein
MPREHEVVEPPRPRSGCDLRVRERPHAAGSEDARVRRGAAYRAPRRDGDGRAEYEGDLGRSRRHRQGQGACRRLCLHRVGGVPSGRAAARGRRRDRKDDAPARRDRRGRPVRDPRSLRPPRGGRVESLLRHDRRPARAADRGCPPRPPPATGPRARGRPPAQRARRIAARSEGCRRRRSRRTAGTRRGRASAACH